MDPLSAVAEALPRTVEAVAAVAVAVRPDPAVAAVRAERMRRGLVRFEAHHRGRLVAAAGRLRREVERRPPGRVRDAMEARLEGVLEELSYLADPTPLPADVRAIMARELSGNAGWLATRYPRGT